MMVNREMRTSSFMACLGHSRAGLVGV